MRVSRFIAAAPETLFGALMDGEALVRWLPPHGMRAELELFNPRVGGGYRMVLRYAGGGRGKSSDDTDVVEVRFVDLVAGRRIVQAVDFQSEDPAFAGTMTMTWRFEPAQGGTQVSVEVANAPSGISEADHEAGIGSSLENLARYVGG